MALYLGIDLSTQSATAILLDGSLAPAAPALSVNFDAAFPEYGTHAGMNQDGPVVTSPVRMWLRALDALMDRLAATGLLSRVAVVSVSGQQHGSVYWTAKGLEALRLPAGPAGGSAFSFSASLDEGCFALADSPIWSDASTGAQCAALEASLPGGAAELADISGSRAYCRFTGPQIAAVAERHPAAWERTAAVSLVSSFVASLLVGSLAPMDASDACGTNLVDWRKRRWHSPLLAAIPGLDVARLGGQPCAPHAVLGRVSPAVAARWGLPPDCAVVAASGDNPNSLAGLGVCARGDLALSLGTSTTLLGVQEARTATPALEGHVMVLPTDAGAGTSHIYIYIYIYVERDLLWPLWR